MALLCTRVCNTRRLKAIGAGVSPHETNIIHHEVIKRNVLITRIDSGSLQDILFAAVAAADVTVCFLSMEVYLSMHVEPILW